VTKTSTRPLPPAVHSDVGPEGNERLTAATGAVLLVLFAAEGVTILLIHQLLTLHIFLGFLLIGPLCLKLGSTGYRFFRYYSGSPAYRRKGPPVPLLRMLAPLLVITSFAVLASGVGLALFGMRLGPIPLLLAHRATFLAWAAVMAVHVLAYARRLPRLIAADLGRRTSRHGIPAPAGTAVRWTLLAGSLAAGLVIAFTGTPLASGWTR
jgi:hypothetical protein